MTVGQSSRRGRGCGGSLVALRVFSDSKDIELRTLEMTLPLCHVKSVRRHRGTAVRFASLLSNAVERIRFFATIFSRFLNTHLSFCSVNLFFFC